MALLTQKEYARHRRVTPQYINRCVRDGRIRLTRDGKVDADKADLTLAKSAQRPERSKTARKAQAGPGRPPRGSATASLTAYRAENEKYKAALAKLEYEKTSGQLLPRDQVLEAERKKNERIRSQFRALPRQLAARLARTVDAGECERLLQEEVDRRLAELAQDPLGLASPAAPAVPAVAVQTPAIVPPPSAPAAAGVSA